jgi:PST family polysaccharide transporter
MARGAAWMVSLRLLMRGLGVISTLILARLLMPEDFGLVALAMAIYGFSGLLGAFGLDAALIHKQDAADRSHYDSAWTMNLLYGALQGLVLALLAGPLAALFGDERLVPIVYILAGLAFLERWENIGVVDFRKELRFHKEFQYELPVRLLRFAVTVGLAFALRNYWALVAGMVAGRVFKVALSYAMHAYRPRLSLERAGELFRFGKWFLASNVFGFVNQRGDMLILGGLVGTTPLGFYRVGFEIANLPSSELVAPMVRAIFPGYAKAAANGELAPYVRRMLGAFALLAVPAGVGMALVADPLVTVVLGAKWQPAAPLMAVLAIYGVLSGLVRANHPVFLALGKPWVTTYYTGARALLTVPVLLAAVHMGGALGAAWGQLGIAAVLAIPYAVVLVRELALTWGELAGVLWRPAAAAGLMAAVVSGLGDLAGHGALAQLLLLVPAGAVVYGLAGVGLWWLAGWPEGAEADFLRWLGRKTGPRAGRALRGLGPLGGSRGR